MWWTMGCALYLGCGVLVWYGSLRTERPHNDRIEVFGGIVMAVLRLPALLLVACVPRRRRQRWDADAQRYVREVRGE